MQDLDWDDLRYVLVLGRSGRLATAALQLRVNATTVARRIARIESVLQAQLFARIDGRLLLTEIGQAVVRHAERIEVDIGEIGTAATGADTKAVGSVRLTAIPLLINRLLVPALSALRAAHPLLQMQFVAEPRNLSLIGREADIALRFARPESDYRAIARRVGEFAYAVYGPSDTKEKALPWITYESRLSVLPHVRWMAAAIEAEPAAGTALIVNDSDVAVHAVRAGLGRSLLPCCIADREPGLKRLRGRKPVLTRELWLLVHPDLRHLARIRAVIDWIEQVLADLNARSPAAKRLHKSL